VRFIDALSGAGVAAVLLLAACSHKAGEAPGDTPAPATAARTQPGVGEAPKGSSAAPAAAAGVVALPAPRQVRNWNEVRLQAAERMVASNPQGTYTGVVPETLLAVPVLEIELNGDGSVRRIEVLRSPRQARDTIEIASAAVRRAAPYGNVSRLPKPWKFVETFLFDDDRRFKPRTLD
jgi:hypothetical protein